MDQNMQTESIKIESLQTENAITEYIKRKDRQFKKSLIATFVMLIAAVAIFCAQTYAYFVDSSASSQNVISAGVLDMEIIELQEGENRTEQSVKPIHILPGTSFNRGVMVKNEGNLPFYVRIKVEKNVLQSENTIPDGWEELISCNFNVDDETTTDVSEGLWVYRDGYYYYIIAVTPGSSTTALFDTVTISPEMDNAFENSEIQFNVICQAVQSRGNSDSPLTAFGWPTEPAATE